MFSNHTGYDSWRGPVFTPDNVQEVVQGIEELGVFDRCIALVTSFVRQDEEPGYIEMLAISEQESWLIKTPLLDFPTVMSGSGDATSAIFLARYLQTKNLRVALEHVACAMFAVFDNTHKHQHHELMLIESQESLVNPAMTFSASRVN